MTDLNLTPYFKNSTLIFCQVRYIFSIYIPNMDRSGNENHQRVQGWNPTTRNIKSNHKWDLIFLIIEKRSPCMVSEQLNEDNNKNAIFEGMPSIGFLSTMCSRISYLARTDWDLYRINLFTWVSIKFQQKTNLALKNQLDTQIALLFGDWTWYDKW